MAVSGMFQDRRDGGRALASWLARRAGGTCVVLAVARGGAVTGYEVATRLALPWSVVAVRRLLLPGRPGSTVGAVAEGGVLVTGPGPVGSSPVAAAELAEARRQADAEVARMARRYRGGRPLPDLTGRTAVVVDDGVVTGASARAACSLARARGARRVLLASPVATPDAVAGLFAVADEVVRVAAPFEVRRLARWYASFPPVRDQDVVALLRRGPITARSA